MTTTTKTLTTALLCKEGTYWLTGHRGHDLTARFDLRLDAFDGGTSTVLTNADWPTTFRTLAPALAVRDIAWWLRLVLPPVVYDVS